jgi:hypothetical protein
MPRVSGACFSIQRSQSVAVDGGGGMTVGWSAGLSAGVALGRFGRRGVFMPQVWREQGRAASGRISASRRR